jgi:hypothetical protein
MTSGYESSYFEDKKDENMSMMDFFDWPFWCYFTILRIRLISAFSREYISSLIYERMRHVKMSNSQITFVGKYAEKV